MNKKRFIAGALTILMVLSAVVFLRQPVFWYRYFAIGPDIWTAQPVVFRPREVVKGGEGGELPFVDSDAWSITPHAVDAAINHAEMRNTDALIVLQGGHVEVERYWGTATRDTVYNGSAISGVVAALLTGIAIDEGHIDSVDDPIGKYLSAWENDPRGEITLRHALQMRSGLEAISYSRWPWSQGSAYLFGAEFEKSLLNRQAVEAPGTNWVFNPEDINLVGLVLEKATGRRYTEYLSEKIWQPLGLSHSLVYVDRKNGQAMQSCCLMSRPMDWAKVGQLVLNKGRFDGKKIVSANWVRQMTKRDNGAGSFGFQIWLGDSYVDYSGASAADRLRFQVPAGEPFAASDVMVLHSPGYQRVWIFPEYELVVVRAASEEAPNWDETYLPNLLVAGFMSNHTPDNTTVPPAPLQVNDRLFRPEDLN